MAEIDGYSTVLIVVALIMYDLFIRRWFYSRNDDTKAQVIPAAPIVQPTIYQTAPVNHPAHITPRISTLAQNVLAQSIEDINGAQNPSGKPAAEPYQTTLSTSITENIESTPGPANSPRSSVVPSTSDALRALSEQKYGNNYSFDKIGKIPATRAIKFTCNIHNNSFEQKVADYLKSPGCCECIKERDDRARKLTEKELIDSAVDGYWNNCDKSSFYYDGKKIQCRCLLCKTAFVKTTTEYKEGKGCPNCARRHNVARRDLFAWLAAHDDNGDGVVADAIPGPADSAGRKFVYDFRWGKTLIILDKKESVIAAKKRHTIAIETEKMVAACRDGYNVIRVYKESISPENDNWQRELLTCVSSIKNAAGESVVCYVGGPVYDKIKEEFKIATA